MEKWVLSSEKVKQSPSCRHSDSPVWRRRLNILCYSQTPQGLDSRVQKWDKNVFRTSCPHMLSLSVVQLPFFCSPVLVGDTWSLLYIRLNSLFWVSPMFKIGKTTFGSVSSFLFLADYTLHHALKSEPRQVGNFPKWVWIEQYYLVCLTFWKYFGLLQTYTGAGRWESEHLTCCKQPL